MMVIGLQIRTSARWISRLVDVLIPCTIRFSRQIPIPDRFSCYRENTLAAEEYVDVWNNNEKEDIYVKNIEYFLEHMVYMSVYLKCDCISISRITCFSTRPFTNSTLYNVFRATIYWVVFSLARYTRPNFPLPNGEPISKSSKLHW